MDEQGTGLIFSCGERRLHFLGFYQILNMKIIIWLDGIL